MTRGARAHAKARRRASGEKAPLRLDHAPDGVKQSPGNSAPRTCDLACGQRDASSAAARDREKSAGMPLSFELAVFLTYTLPADALARGYETWLRDVDNPFFNTIPGVGRYENWRIAREQTPSLGYTHFDLMFVASEDALQRAWFDARLDAFRTGWIAEWGYGAAAPVNTFAYLMRGTGAPAARRTDRLVLRGGDAALAPGDGARESWQVVKAVRKHYAIGPAPAGEAWLVDIDGHPGPGFRWLSLAYVDDAAAFDRITFCGNDALCAEATLIAAPS
jgi:hypothetical protein